MKESCVFPSHLDPGEVIHHRREVDIDIRGFCKKKKQSDGNALKEGWTTYKVVLTAEAQALSICAAECVHFQAEAAMLTMFNTVINVCFSFVSTWQQNVKERIKMIHL